MAEKPGKDGLTPTQRYRSRNRERRNADARAWKAAHPEKTREWKRKSYQRNADQVHYYWVGKKYGLSREGYDAMVAQQGNRCAICGIDFAHLTRRPAVDHCHTTGKVRALLCTVCNVRVGVVETEAGWRDAIIAYIEQHRKAG